MFCLDCHHDLVYTIEKALAGRGCPSDAPALVAQSTLSGDWVCDVTGNEHRRGDAIDFQRYVRESLPPIFELVESEDITAEQALSMIQIGLGFKERSEEGKHLAKVLKAVDEGIVPATALRLVLGEGEE